MENMKNWGCVTKNAKLSFNELENVICKTFDIAIDKADLLRI